MKENAKSHPALQQPHTLPPQQSDLWKKRSTSSFVLSFWYANEERGSPSNQEVTGLIAAVTSVSSSEKKEVIV